ncbi:MAG: hypothetical protein ACOY82_13590 [Pseudomonadota bacterium]
MTRLMFAAALFVVAMFAAGTRAAESVKPVVSQEKREALHDFPWPRLPTSPAWGQLRGTTLVYDGMQWERVPSEVPGHRSFVLSSLSGVLGVHEMIEPEGETSPAAILARMESSQRLLFLSFVDASRDSPLNRLTWPPGGACGHFKAEKQEGLPSWYSHCVFVRDRQATYLNVVVPLDTGPEAIVAIDEVLATIRPRPWRSLAGFATRSFPDVDGVPVSLPLRLPERFAPSGSEYGSTRLFCDRDDEVQFGRMGPSDRGSCIEIRVSPRETYSPETGRFSSEDMFESWGGKVREYQFTSRKRTIRDRPTLELTLVGADHVQHALLIVDGARVLDVFYTEPTGIGAEGYDGVWRELLKELERP